METFARIVAYFSQDPYTLTLKPNHYLPRQEAKGFHLHHLSLEGNVSFLNLSRGTWKPYHWVH